MNIKNYLSSKFQKHTTLKYPGLYRPSSYPYISGDGFRKLADHIFDETGTLNPNRVKTGQIVFIKTELKEIYFKHYHKSIKYPYYLISHNSDESVEEKDLELIDDKIIHWFAMKLNIPSTSKISPLPAGLENARFRNNGKISNFQAAFKNKIIKTNKILSSFNPNTNFKERNPLINIAKKHTDIDILHFEDRLEYLKQLSTFEFNLCPEGNNYESHRIWESLIFGTTPIVVKNNVNNNFFNLGVPLLMINNWSELNELTFSDLKTMNKINAEKNYLDFVLYEFWENFIYSKFK